MGFRVPGPDEYSGEGFGTLSPDTYRARIASYKMKQGAEVTNQYNLDGALRIWFTLEPLFIEGDEDAEMLGIDNKPIREDKTLIFFFDPSRLGLKPKVSKSRKFFASAMGIPVEQPVEFADEESMAKALVGKEIVIDVEVNQKGSNAVVDTRPVRQRTRRVKASETATEAVAAATAVFEGEVEDSKEVDGEY